MAWEDFLNNLNRPNDFGLYQEFERHPAEVLFELLNGGPPSGSSPPVQGGINSPDSSPMEALWNSYAQREPTGTGNAQPAGPRSVADYLSGLVRANPGERSPLETILSSLSDVSGRIGEIQNPRYPNPARGAIEQRDRQLDRQVQRALQKKEVEQRDRQLKLSETNQAMDMYFKFRDNLELDDPNGETDNALFQAFLKTYPQIGENLRQGGIDPANVRFTGKKGETAVLGNVNVTGSEGYIDGTTGEPLVPGLYEEIKIKPRGDRRIVTSYKRGKPESSLGKIDQKDWTPESFQAFMAAGGRDQDRRLLVPAPKDAPVHAPDTTLFNDLVKKYGNPIAAASSPEWKAHRERETPDPNRPRTTREKDQLLSQLRGEARRTVNARFQGQFGSLDLTKLDKDPTRANTKYRQLINEALQELLDERGLTLADLTTSGPSSSRSGSSGPAKTADDYLNSKSGDY